MCSWSGLFSVAASGRLNSSIAPDVGPCCARLPRPRSGRSRSVGGAPCGGAVYARSSEARRLQRLVAGDRRARQRALGALLEHEPQALKRAARLALQPAAGAQRFLERVPADAGLAPRRQADLGRAVLARELPLGPAGGASPASDAPALDDPPRPVHLDHLELGA